MEASAQTGRRVRLLIPGGDKPASFAEHISRLKSVGANPVPLSTVFSSESGVLQELSRFAPGTRFSVWAGRGGGQVGHVWEGQIDSTGKPNFLETQTHDPVRWSSYSSFWIIIH